MASMASMAGFNGFNTHNGGAPRRTTTILVEHTFDDRGNVFSQVLTASNHKIQASNHKIQAQKLMIPNVETYAIVMWNLMIS